jgi:hypothetical protein
MNNTARNDLTVPAMCRWLAVLMLTSPATVFAGSNARAQDDGAGKILTAMSDYGRIYWRC